jgi:hypothetical protein
VMAVRFANRASPQEGMVAVLVAENATHQALAESALREAGIEFVTKNDPIQHMLGAGQIGGINLVAGPPTIQVSAHDADDARDVLRHLTHGSDVTSDSPPLEELDESYSLAEQKAIRQARYSAVWSVLYLWGIGSVLAFYFGFTALRSQTELPVRSRVLAIAGLSLGTLGIVVALMTLVRWNEPPGW